MASTTKRDVAGLGLSLLITGAAGAIGSIFTRSAIPGWYRTLNKPDWTPPGSIFGPVWTLLYALMGIAAFLVWQRRDEHPEARRGLQLFGVQLTLNVLWSGLFFGLRSPAAGLIEIAGLWLAIVATVVSFARVSRVAAVLMLPYLAWTTFASALNGAIWWMNR